jgi:EAL domain-containing protein (putative c-di-GMP-specific phosphodiesterase class I)/CheY-like chemotaxis protein
MRVLVIEDDAFQRALLVAGLDAIGVASVVEANEAQSALRLLQEDGVAFDLTLCDLYMDGGDGIEFIRRAGGLPLGQFVLMSALDDDLVSSAELIAHSYDLCWGGRLAKPLTRTSLQAVLQQCCNSTLRPRQARRERARLPGWNEAELRDALERGEFVPYFQPKVDLKSGRVAGLEMLARWRHPELGMIAPDSFIPAMECTGLVTQMMENLLDQALASLSFWLAKGMDLHLAVNASPLTLQHEGAARRLQEQVERFGIAPVRVTVELTESVIADQKGALMESLLRLRMAGFGIALDDFGTGFSSLQQLSCSPFTELKIDRSFVNGAMHSPRKLAILEWIAGLARALKLRVVAEGIESGEDLALVQRVQGGEGLMQGYLFSPPMPAEAFPCWLRGFEETACEAELRCVA